MKYMKILLALHSNAREQVEVVNTEEGVSKLEDFEWFYNKFFIFCNMFFRYISLKVTFYMMDKMILVLQMC